ncbi:small acid-soluble spore protein P [Brevibacillus daliensis]|nr:small acid-soluble spore protein P [Brevibacillus daliensis]
MAKDDFLFENPHQTYNNQFRPLEQTGEPLSGTKQVKQKNHSRQKETREG